MESLYNVNGLVFWTEKEIHYRKFIEKVFANSIEAILRKENRAWHFTEIEAPVLIPRELINKNYTNEDIFVQETLGDKTTDLSDLALRPETTPASYAYACHIIKNNIMLPPFCVFQTGKSFRREQDQVSKNMRLKEFYQQEFQCIYSESTLNDYQTAVLEPLREMFQRVIGKPARIVESDRLPDYSIKTMDIEVDNGDKWMEICSISVRKDFPIEVNFQSKKGVTAAKMLVLEIAIGLDRCVYNYFL